MRWSDTWGKQPNGPETPAPSPSIFRFKLRGRRRQGEVVVIQAPLNIAVGFHEIFGALAAGTQQRIRCNLQPLQDGGDVVGGAGPAGVGDQVFGSPVA